MQYGTATDDITSKSGDFGDAPDTGTYGATRRPSPHNIMVDDFDLEI